MHSSCRSFCGKYKADKGGINSKSTHKRRYGDLNQKRCSICDVFMNWQGARCPCCKAILRCKPVNNHARQATTQMRRSVYY